MKKYVALLNYRDNYTENLLQHKFPNISIMYVFSENKKKYLRKDITLNYEELAEYITANYTVICVGAETLKALCRLSGINKLTGNCIKAEIKELNTEIDVFPLIDPKIGLMYPEKNEILQESISKIKNYVKPKEIKHILVTTQEQLNAMIKDIKEVFKKSDKKVIAYDTETASLNTYLKDVILASYAVEEDKGYAVISELIPQTQELFDEADIIVMHNAKFDIHKSRNMLNFDINKIQDTMIIHFLIDENAKHGLKELALQYTDLGNYESTLDTHKKKYCKLNGVSVKEFTYDLLPTDVLYQYAVKDAIATLRLFNVFSSMRYNQQLAKKLVYISKQLGQVELNGGLIDYTYLTDLEQQYQDKLTEIMTQMDEHLYSLDIIDINYNSTKQLRELLFDVMEYKSVKQTESGADSTDEETLNKLLNQDNPNNFFIESLLKYRKLSKFYSTYVKGIKKLVIKHKYKDYGVRHFIHSSFNITGTSSGRLSSNNPNFQNIPSKDKTIKKMFVCEPDEYVVQIDLKNAELFVSQYLAGNYEFCEQYEKGLDLHSVMAKKIFELDCPVEEVKEKHNDLRQKAKTTNFLILYGGGAGELSKKLNVPKKKAQELIDKFFEVNPKLTDYIKKQKNMLLLNDFLVSYFGRIKHANNLKSSNSYIREKEIKSSINFLIQSVSSDISLFSFSLFQDWAIKNDIQVFTLVHDSIVYRCKKDQLKESVNQYRECLNTVMHDWKYKIKIDVEIGDSYGNLEEITV